MQGLRTSFATHDIESIQLASPCDSGLHVIIDVLCRHRGSLFGPALLRHAFTMLQLAMRHKIVANQVGVQVTSFLAP